MTKGKYKIDTSSLEDGENILWAAKTQPAKRNGRWKYVFWVLCFMYVILLIQNIRMGDFTWPIPTNIWAFIGVCALVVLLIWGMQKQMAFNSWIDKETSGYYAILITNQRLVLSSAGGLDNIELYCGQIKSVRPDYSGGSQALHLSLLDGVPLRSVTITTEGDIAALKQMIENGFITKDTARGVDGVMA